MRTAAYAMMHAHAQRPWVPQLRPQRAPLVAASTSAILLLGCLFLQLASAQSPPPPRTGPNAPRPAATKTAGSFRLGALVPVSDGGNRVKAAFVYATDLINNDTALLPGHLLEPLVFSVGVGSVDAPAKSVELLENSLACVIGPTTSSVAKPVAYLLRPFRLLQISPAATDPDLSTKSLYDYFTRNIPSDNLQGPALARVVLALGWRSVGVLYSDDTYGQNLAKAFISEARNVGVRIPAFATYSDAIPDKTPQLLTLKAASAFVIAVFSSAANQSTVFESAQRVGMLTPEYVYLGGDGLTGGPRGVPPEMLQGTLGLQPETLAATNQTAAFLAGWARQSPADYLGAGGSAIDVFSALTVDAVYMVARALHALLASGAQLNGTYAARGQRSAVPFGAQLKATVVGTPVEGISGTIALDANGDRVAPFVLVQYDGGVWRRRARYTFAGGLDPPQPPIVWKGGVQPFDGWCAAGTALAQAGAAACVACAAGSYSQVGFRACVPCPAGSYSAAPGSDRCLPCAPGTFAPAEGAATCTACSPGTFAVRAGATECDPCGRGTYENRLGSVGCTPAGPSEFVPGLGSTAPTECPANAVTPRAGATNVSECRCIRGFYSVGLLDGAAFDRCYACADPGGVCDGGPLLAVQPGFYRLPWSYHTLLECPKGACSGGAAVGNATQCSAGYIGNFCSTCDFWYGATRMGGDDDFTCASCASPSLSALVVFVSVVCIIIVAGLMSYLAVRSVFTPSSEASIVARILINHVQFNSFIQSIPLRWPDLVARILVIGAAANNPVDSFVSIDCVMADTSYPRELVFFYKAAGYMFLPLLALTLPAIAVSALAWARKLSGGRGRARRLAYSPGSSAGREAAAADRSAAEQPVLKRFASATSVLAQKVTDAVWPWPDRGDSQPSDSEQPPRPPLQPASSAVGVASASYEPLWVDYYVVIAMVSVFLIFPMVSVKALELFRCKSLSGGGTTKSFVRGSMDVECFSPEHGRWLLSVGIPGIALISIGVPLLATAIVWRGRGGRLRNPTYALRYGFLLQGYKAQYYGWEVVQIWRKTSVIFASVFLSDLSDELLLFGLAFFIINTCIDSYVLPFRGPLLNILNLSSQAVNLLTVYCGLVYRNVGNMTGPGRTFLASVIILANLAFLVEAAIILARAFIILLFQKIPYFRRSEAHKAQVYRMLRHKSSTGGEDERAVVIAAAAAAEAAAADGLVAGPEAPSEDGAGAGDLEEPGEGIASWETVVLGSGASSASGGPPRGRSRGEGDGRRPSSSKGRVADGHGGASDVEGEGPCSCPLAVSHRRSCPFRVDPAAAGAARNGPTVQVYQLVPLGRGESQPPPHPFSVRAHGERIDVDRPEAGERAQRAPPISTDVDGAPSAAVWPVGSSPEPDLAHFFGPASVASAGMEPHPPTYQDRDPEQEEEEDGEEERRQTAGGGRHAWPGFDAFISHQDA